MTEITKINQWNRWHAGLIFFIGLATIYLENNILLILGAIGSFTYYFFSHLSLLRTYQPFGGYANWVTSFRLLLLFILLAWGTQIEFSTIFGIALIAISLDGLDGYLARKYNTASSFGAYFDMETDAFYVCLMSFLLYQNDLLPSWILLIGLMRYGAVIAEIILGLHGQPAPPNPFARYIAGFLFVVLLMPWVFPKTIYYLPVSIGAILVTFSFAYSFYLFFKKT